jgi:hypothetical protein
MTLEPCKHANRVSGVVELGFSRQNAPNGPVYSGAVSVGICEKCGQIELYGMYHGELCAWLKKN